MSLMDKIKSLFSGGSSAATDDHAGHDHSGNDHAGHDHSDEPAAPMSEPGSDAGEDRPA